MIGELEQAGARWRLRFVRELAQPAEQVWRALTETEHLAAWFPQRIVGEWRVGSSLRFEFPGDEAPPFDGEVLACDPPTLLEFRWGPDTIRIEIAPGAAGCTLTLTDTIEDLGKAARDGAGWHVCLDRLEHALEDTAPEWSANERWGEVHLHYVAKFGPDAAAVGPAEDMA